MIKIGPTKNFNQDAIFPLITQNDFSVLLIELLWERTKKKKGRINYTEQFIDTYTELFTHKGSGSCVIQV